MTYNSALANTPISLLTLNHDHSTFIITHVLKVSLEDRISFASMVLTSRFIVSTLTVKPKKKTGSRFVKLLQDFTISSNTTSDTALWYFIELVGEEQNSRKT